MASAGWILHPVGHTDRMWMYAGPGVSEAFFTFSRRSNGKLGQAVAT
jgi:hypothetical protein